MTVLQRFSAVLAVLFLHAAVFTAPASAMIQREGIAAVVNEKIVSYTDLRNRIMLNLIGFQGQITPDVQQQAEQHSLDELVNEVLQMQEAERLGIEVTTQQIREGITHIAQQNGMDPDEFRYGLRSAGVPISTLEDKVRAEIAWSYVVQRQLRPQINVSESEIDAAFERLERRRETRQFRLAEIVLKDDGRGDEAMYNRVIEILQHLQSGAPFRAVAAEFSESATAARGGDLGWMEPADLPRQYREAVTELQPGQVAPPVEVEGGVAILLVVDRHDGRTDAPRSAYEMPPPEAAETVTAESADMRVMLKQIVIPVTEDEPEAVVTAKTARAATLAREINSCEEMEERMAHFLSADTGSVGPVDVAQLPPPMAKLVSELPIGKLSPPVPHRNGIAVIMVCERTGSAPVFAEHAERAATPAAPPASTGDDMLRDEIANEIGGERLMRLQEHYLRDLRAAAYIEWRLQ